MQDRIVLDQTQAQELTETYAEREPQDILEEVLQRFRSRIALCTSFQTAGMVILDMAVRIDPNVRILTIDTGRLPQETYELLDQVRDTYGIEIEIFLPDVAEVEQLVRKHGTNLFYRSPELRLKCCEARKVMPLQRALSTMDAWITGLRVRDSKRRANTRKIEIDHEHGGIIKVNPLADWTEEQVWDYIRAHNVPYHPFYDRGYTSIGCAPCTRPPAPGEDPRAGRWWWEAGVPKECGMHCAI